MTTTTDGDASDAAFESLKSEVAQRLTQKREATGLSQTEAAAKLGVTPPKLSAYENGKNFPRADKLYLLACLYDTSVEYLISGKQDTTEAAVSRTAFIEFLKVTYGIGAKIELLAQQIKQNSETQLGLTGTLERQAESSAAKVLTGGANLRDLSTEEVLRLTEIHTKSSTSPATPDAKPRRRKTGRG